MTVTARGIGQAAAPALAVVLMAGTCLAGPVRAQPAPPVGDGASATLDELSVVGERIGTAGPRGGVTVGYLAKATRSATKTDTPLIDTPQSVSVVTQQQIRDQNVQNLTDQLRYVPGVIPAQGEGNRDQAVIRGQSSSADFYVNGVRDDV